MVDLLALLALLDGIHTGLGSSKKVRKKNDIKEAYRLARENRYEEALTILEQLNLRDEYTAVNLLGLMVKAICYAELKYTVSAKECVRIILDLPATLNPFYMYVRSNARKVAKQIEEEYDL